jgi:hypothetical protein
MNESLVASWASESRRYLAMASTGAFVASLRFCHLPFLYSSLSLLGAHNGRNFRICVIVASCTPCRTLLTARRPLSLFAVQPRFDAHTEQRQRLSPAIAVDLKTHC